MQSINLWDLEVATVPAGAGLCCKVLGLKTKASDHRHGPQSRSSVVQCRRNQEDFVNQKKEPASWRFLEPFGDGTSDPASPAC